MSNAIAERLITREREHDVPLGLKVLAAWAGLRVLPMLVFPLYLIAQTVEHLSAAGFWGSLLSLTLVVGILIYAGYAAVTAISLWNGSPTGIQGVVGLATVGWLAAFMFLGTEDPAWMLGFTPELYPLALAGVHELSLVGMFVLMNVVCLVPIWYVFSRRDAFM